MKGFRMGRLQYCFAPHKIKPNSPDKEERQHGFLKGLGWVDYTLLCAQKDQAHHLVFVMIVRKQIEHLTANIVTDSNIYKLKNAREHGTRVPSQILVFKVTKYVMLQDIYMRSSRPQAGS